MLVLMVTVKCEDDDDGGSEVEGGGGEAGVGGWK